MYPIETWNSTQPTADFVRLLAVTLGGRNHGDADHEDCWQGNVTSSRAHSAPIDGHGRHHLRHRVGLVIDWICWYWCTIVGTILGLMPPRIGIRRSHGMGIILVPIMIYTFAQMADSFGFI